MHNGRVAWVLAAATLLGAGVALASAEPAVQAAADATPDRIARLIDELGDPAYSVRKRAQDELVKLGYEAFDALVDAQASDDPEIAMQAGYLVRLVRVDWTRESDPKAVQQILKDYEAQSDERRLARIKQLAELPGGLGLEWLCRLVRFERSSVVAKHAALAILAAAPPADTAAATARARLIHQTLDRGRRAGAKWVLTWLDAARDPADAVKAWSALVDAERTTLEQHPQETAGPIVMELLRRKVELLERLGRQDEIHEAMRQMVQVEHGDPASLGELVDWLAKRKAWTVIDEVATRFAASFDGDALLLYTLCEARMAQGNTELVEKTAERALKLSGESGLDHLGVVERLMDRGLTHWSDRELRYIIAQGPIASPVAVHARQVLSESLHDRQQYLEAAEVLKGLIDAMDSDANVQQQVRQLLQPKDKKPGTLHAKMYFYQAAQAAQQGDRAQQRKLLDKALEQDSEELDVLIALYRATEGDGDARANVLRSVRKVIDDCRTAIEESPDELGNYNELAWLVANTEGDIDEAIRLSQKSVDMVRSGAVSSGDVRRVGQYLDTLAHCYFAKKDYAQAVKTQSEAARLDPYSQAIGRQLNVFRAALAASESK